MKKQTFYKQKKLKSQKSLEYSSHNSFNFQEYSQNHNIKEKNDFRNNISLDNLENNNINNNMNKINSTIKIEKYGKLGELNYEIEQKNIILIPDNFNGDINSLKLELLPKEKYFFISGVYSPLVKCVYNGGNTFNPDLPFLAPSIRTIFASKCFLGYIN